MGIFLGNTYTRTSHLRLQNHLGQRDFPPPSRTAVCCDIGDSTLTSNRAPDWYVSTSVCGVGKKTENTTHIVYKSHIYIYIYDVLFVNIYISLYISVCIYVRSFDPKLY